MWMHNLLLTPLRTEPKNIVLKESCYIAIKEQRYTSHAYREKLTELGMIQSMSRRGNCWDNACIENFLEPLSVRVVIMVHWKMDYSLINRWKNL
ncbi:hypothetical protein TPHV1_60124 [Treponema phagedenis]|uniref:Transposase n=1 Tax=Treponema phagedenis TaxID=162 RepID=A0A0B7H2E8_TREPH|nr:hypothetical protein TPHV1_60124 [Treponema phagedenis]